MPARRSRSGTAVKLIVTALKRLGSALFASVGNIAFWMLVVAHTTVLPEAIGEETSPSVLPAHCCQPPPAASDPPVWGVVGLMGYPAGKHEAANGLAFDPLVGLTSDFNIGLLPRKQLYLFWQSNFWVQSGAVGIPATSQREFDADLGLGWNYFDSLELRASLYSLNNLNRGSSLARPDGYKDGVNIENRYYFGSGDIHDVGTLPFVGIGYSPQKSLVGNNGQVFQPGLFGRGYLTQDLPTPFRSYAYGGLQLTAQSVATPRLLDTDVGLAVRPFSNHQGFELRVGYDRTDDVQAHVTRELVYGAMRIGFGMAAPETSAPDFSPSWPEIWGVVGLPVYPTGNRMAPNGVSFRPILGVTSDLNLGLLPHKELYLFSEGVFWAQHSAPNVTQSSVDFSKRELDSEVGLAWNYFDLLELRASAYALDNLNRGTSPNNATGGKQGIKLENRYYLNAADPYDVGRLSFVSLGYIPTENLVGGNGASFRPGLFARTYLAGDLPISWLWSYLYAGQQITGQNGASPRLIDTDVGWAIRPLAGFRNLELRIGYDLTADVQKHTARNVVYGAVRLAFDPAGFGLLRR
jgi:hypothetical protein